MPSQKELDSFAQGWDRLMDACHARKEPRSVAFSQLVTAYTEPHRHYHNLLHIGTMFLVLDKAPAGYLKDECPLVKLAAWYHDVVYDPHSSENESRSAEIATSSLRKLGLDENCIARVSALILMTKDHLAPEQDLAAHLFLDADLCILAADPEGYSEYAKAIRQEYAWVAERDYYQARQKVLRRFLDRPTIYWTRLFVNDGCETKARANIAGEIAEIDERLGTLPP
jgi:predicted metal-dependent HD superfamily phosphohydrolase